METKKLFNSTESKSVQKGDVVLMRRGQIDIDIQDAKYSFGRALQQAVFKGNKQECAKALIGGIDKLEGT